MLNIAQFESNKKYFCIKNLVLAAIGGGASGGVASAGGWMDTVELVVEPPAETVLAGQTL